MRKLILASLFLTAQLFSFSSHAALFDDTEARKKILELEKTMQSQNQATQSALAELKKDQHALEQRLTSLESIAKNGLVDMQSQVESLKQENRLLVFSYKGAATVETGRSILWIFRGNQQLQVPAVVNYYLDLSQLTLSDVTYDERAKLVRVRLPKLTIGDIAFQPENATTINGGILSFSDEQVEDLRKLNYAAARKAMVAQSQQKGLVDAAKRQAIANIQNYFEIPLRIAGLPDVKVTASFQ